MPKPLQVILGLNSEQFISKLAAARNQAGAFGKDVTGALSLSGKAFTGLGDIVSAPFKAATGNLNTLKAGLASLGSVIPGLGMIAPILLHPMESAEKALGRTLDLAREAKHLGMDATGLRALQLAAGPDAEGATKAFQKILRLQGEIKTGSGELMGAGQGTAMDKLARYGIDPKAVAGMSGKEFIETIVAKGASIEDTSKRIKFSFDVAGKAGSNLLTLFEAGPKQIAKWNDELLKMAAYSDQNIAIAKTWKALQKEMAVRKEANEQSMLPSGGVMSYGWDQIKEGSPLSGLLNIGRGGWNYAARMAGADSAVSLPKEMRDRVYDIRNEQIREEGRQMLAAKKAKDAGFVDVEDQKKITDILGHWRELTETIGMSAEQAELYKLHTERAAGPVRDMVEQQIKLYHATKQVQDNIDSRWKFDDEMFIKKQAMDWAEFEKNRNPLDKLRDLNGPDLFNQFQSLESQYGTNQSARFASALQAGSAGAYSTDIAGRSGGAQDMAARVAELKGAIELRRSEAKMQADMLREALDDIADALMPAD